MITQLVTPDEWLHTPHPRPTGWVPKSPEEWQNATPEQVRSFNEAVLANLMATKESAMAPADKPGHPYNVVDPYPRVRADQYPEKSDAPENNDAIPPKLQERLNKAKQLREQGQKMLAESEELEADVRRAMIDVAKRAVEALHALGIDATLNVRGERLG